jgi:hypothetical protein
MNTVDGLFVPGKPLQLSLIFMGKTRAGQSEAEFRCSTSGSAPGLIHKPLTRP